MWVMGEVRYQKECVVAQRFPATGKCPTLKAAGGMGVTGVIRNGEWGYSGKSCTNGGSGPGCMYGKGVRDLGFSLVPALPSSPSTAQPYVETIWQESLEMSFPLKTCKKDKVCREWI